MDWNERIATLSVHPDCATRDDVARLAAELMATNARIVALTNARTLAIDTGSLSSRVEFFMAWMDTRHGRWTAIADVDRLPQADVMTQAHLRASTSES